MQKLSGTQKDVVLKMQNGWQLGHNPAGEEERVRLFRSESANRETEIVRLETFTSLKRLGFLEGTSCPIDALDNVICYQLSAKGRAWREENV